MLTLLSESGDEFHVEELYGILVRECDTVAHLIEQPGESEYAGHARIPVPFPHDTVLGFIAGVRGLSEHLDAGDEGGAAAAVPIDTILHRIRSVAPHVPLLDIISLATFLGCGLMTRLMSHAMSIELCSTKDNVDFLRMIGVDACKLDRECVVAAAAATGGTGHFMRKLHVRKLLQ
jgi:hypothetical protein